VSLSDDARKVNGVSVRRSRPGTRATGRTSQGRPRPRLGDRSARSRSHSRPPRARATHGGVVRAWRARKPDAHRAAPVRHREAEPTKPAAAAAARPGRCHRAFLVAHWRSVPRQPPPPCRARKERVGLLHLAGARGGLGLPPPRPARVPRRTGLHDGMVELVARSGSREGSAP
jgi:hypothetical protein